MLTKSPSKHATNAGSQRRPIVGGEKQKKNGVGREGKKGIWSAKTLKKNNEG